MKNNFLVSVIIPVYNTEKYLRDCLDSIISQSYTNWECILIDDGSTDKSGEILLEYAKKDARFKVIQKENGGVSSARNCGIRNMSGDYLCFVDSDDVVDKEYISQLLQLIDDESICLSVCRFKGVKKKAFKIPKNKRETILSLFDIKKGIRGYIGAKMFKTSYIKEKNILFDENQHLAEDVLFIYKYISAWPDNCRAAASTKELYSYTQREDSAIRRLQSQKKYDPTWNNILRTWDIIHDDTADSKIKQSVLLLKVMQTVTIVRFMINCEHENKEEIKNHIWFIRKNLLRYIFSSNFNLRKKLGAVLISFFYKVN